MPVMLDPRADHWLFALRRELPQVVGGEIQRVEDLKGIMSFVGTIFVEGDEAARDAVVPWLTQRVSRELGFTLWGMTAVSFKHLLVRRVGPDGDADESTWRLAGGTNAP